MRESIRSALAHRATTLVVLLITTAMTATVFLTAGRATATEEAILSSVDSAGTRLLLVTVQDPSPGIDDAGRERLSRIEGVEWLLALGAARDVHNAHGAATNVAARSVLSPWLPELTMVEGRAPDPGEAVVSAYTQARLGLVESAGAVTDREGSWVVVGRFSPPAAISDLARLVLVHGQQREPATLVYVLAASPATVLNVRDQVEALAGVPTESLTVEVAPELVELQRVVAGEIGALGRQLAVGALAVGIVLVLLTMTLALSSRRRDFGRRRALGSSRSALVVLVLLEAAVPLLAGAVIGGVTGLFVVHLLAGELPSAAVTVAVPLLVLLSGVVACIPPAVLAAWRDPVAILRVP